LFLHIIFVDDVSVALELTLLTVRCRDAADDSVGTDGAKEHEEADANMLIRCGVLVSTFFIEDSLLPRASSANRFMLIARSLEMIEWMQ
jgi:hypothetical protein